MVKLPGCTKGHLQRERCKQHGGACATDRSTMRARSPHSFAVATAIRGAVEISDDITSAKDGANVKWLVRPEHA